MPRKVYRKKRTKKYGKKGGNLGAKAFRMVKAIQKARETKYIEEDYSDQNIDWSGNLITLNHTSQGLEDFEDRVGDKIWNKFLTMRGHFHQDGTNTIARLTIIVDKTNSITDLSQVYGSPSNAQVVDCPFVKDFENTFRVIFDRRYVVDDQHPQVIWSASRKLRFKTQYLAGSSTITYGALKLIIVGTLNPTEMQKPNFSATYRLTYYDD